MEGRARQRRGVEPARHLEERAELLHVGRLEDRLDRPTLAGGVDAQRGVGGSLTAAASASPGGASAAR